MRKFFPIWTQLILNVNYNICKHDILTFYNLVQESLPPNLHLLIIGKVHQLAQVSVGTFKIAILYS